MIAQTCIAVFGVLSIWLSMDVRPRVTRWGPVFGLISQPFWYYAAIDAQQWGILVLSFFYTVAWGKGFYNHWIKTHSVIMQDDKIFFDAVERVQATICPTWRNGRERLEGRITEDDLHTMIKEFTKKKGK